MANHESFLKYFEEFTFPTSDEITDKAKAIREAAMDTMRMYRGHYGVLMQAFQLFLATDCRPYALLGAVEVLIAASYLSGNNYDAKGLAEAQKFLDKAREIMPNSLDVDLQQAAIYSAALDIARLKHSLNISSQNPESETSFTFASINMSYWGRQKDIPQVEKWHKKAMENATTQVQRLFALRRLAGIYLDYNIAAKALDLYREIVRIDPNDPWAWHNMSLIHLRKKDYSAAAMANRNALNIMEFGVAYNILDSLIKQWQPYRHLNLVEEVPRYLSHEGMPEKKERGLLGRLFGDIIQD